MTGPVPTVERLNVEALSALPDDAPVVMLNLLKFNDGSTDGASPGLERTIVVACSPRVQELAS